MHHLMRSAIVIFMAVMFQFNANAQDSGPSVDNTSYTIFDFTNASYFSNFIVKHPSVPDKTMNWIQESSVVDSRGYKITYGVTQCVSYNFGTGVTCGGIEGVQGGYSATLTSTQQSTRFKKLKLHLAIPNQIPTTSNHLIFGINVELDNAAGDPLSALNCTSSMAGVAIDANTVQLDLSSVAVHDLEVDFSCNKNLKSVSFQTKTVTPYVNNTVDPSIVNVGNPILLKSVDVGSGGYQLVVTPLDENGNALEDSVSSSVQNGSSITLPLGARVGLQLLDTSGQFIPSTYALSGVPSFNPAISADDQAKGLYMDRLGILLPDTFTEEMDSIWVHMGTQALTITPTDPTKAAITIVVNVNAPSSLGEDTIVDPKTSKEVRNIKTYDSLIIGYAHLRGIPPQFIKGEAAQESSLSASSYRYEPVTRDLPVFSNGKNNQNTIYGKYLFRESLNPMLSSDIIHPRNKYGVLYLGNVVAIPNNYETTVVRNQYTPLMCSSIMAINNKGTSTGTTTFKAYNWDKSISVGGYKPVAELDYGNVLFIYKVAQSVQAYSKYKFVAQTVVASSYGLMQVLYTTAASKNDGEYLDSSGVGLTPAGLLDPGTNLKVGSLILRKKYKTANGNLTTYSNFASFVKAWRSGFQKYNGTTVPKDANNDDIEVYNYGVWKHSLNYFPQSNSNIFNQ